MQNVFREISGVNDAMLGMQEIRCKKCHKKLGMVEGDYEIKCPRCGEMNVRKENVENERGTMS